MNPERSPVSEIVPQAPPHGCDCIDKSEAALSKHNTQLDLTHFFSGRASTVTISTSVIEKKRGARPKTVIPNYCPFCGTRYPTGEDAADRQAAAEARP